MPNFRTKRWILPSVLTGLLLAAAAMCTPALAAGTYGELLRFNGKGTGSTKGHTFELEEETHAFGVDPSEGNSVFVGDEKGGEVEEVFRLQKYTEAGAFQGEVLLKPKSKLPNGIAAIEDLDGVAVNASKGVVYVLVTYERSANPDPGTEVSGAIYAFKTVPVGGKLVPAEGANPTTGLLGTTETLKGNSGTQGESLLEPSGITVDPKTNELLILGEVDEGETQGTHVAIQRVSEAGVLLGTYVDPDEFEGIKEPDSPVVSQKGTIFYEDEDEILQVPSNLTSPPKTIYRLEEPEVFTEGPFKEELIDFGEDAEETRFGGALTIISEGAEDEGRLVADAEVGEIAENGTATAENYAALGFDYKEEGENVSLKELGWTGGQPGEKYEGKPCVIGFGGNYPQVAAASGDKSFVLAYSSSEVIEFGPGGSGCPSARAASTGLEATIHGIKVSSVNTGEPVVLSAKIIQANVLSVEWEFENGTKQTTEPQSGSPLEVEQTQAAEVEHVFTTGGSVTVKAVIHTDDLATPTITESTSVTVKAASGFKVTTQPSNQAEVLEGQNATFKAAATGASTIQWEESHDHGTEWADVGAGTSGGTSETLTVLSVKTSENEYEYRATFTNAAKEPAVSKAATLTVETVAAHEAKEAKKAEEKAEAEAKAKAAAKAAAEAAEAQANAAAAAKAKAEAEAAAKKAQEEKEKTGVLGFKEGSPIATVASTSLTVSSSGAVVVKVSCPASVTTCTGSVTLKTLGAVSARYTGAEAKAKVLTLASGSFSVAGGQAKAITLHLSAAARKLLARSHTLRARATIVAHNRAGVAHTAQLTVTLRPAKKSKGK